MSDQISEVLSESAVLEKAKSLAEINTAIQSVTCEGCNWQGADEESCPYCGHKLDDEGECTCDEWEAGGFPLN